MMNKDDLGKQDSYGYTALMDLARKNPELALEIAGINTDKDKISKLFLEVSQKLDEVLQKNNQPPEQKTESPIERRNRVMGKDIRLLRR